ncbi:MAG: hypothetical protein LM557_02075 [Desulfurococcaceae archaeon]|nr:hypothetical protein [Desulfurococcaceae archaeon]MCC6053170.1 hypothetical protein [Desulfurococcaceae archaeon]
MASSVIINRLEEALDLVDKIESTISKLKPGDQISPGLVYQLYETLVLLREKIVEARLKASYCREAPA